MQKEFILQNFKDLKMRNRVSHAYLPAELKVIYAKIAIFSGLILADFFRAEGYVNKL